MRLRAIPSMARVPVALMTASPGVLPVTEVLAVGADELFDKNTDLEALRHQLRGLFVREWQDIAAGLFAARTGLQLDALSGYAQAISRGLLQADGGQVRPTELGWRFLNDTLELFLP